jgi:hypothetical protein
MYMEGHVGKCSWSSRDSKVRTVTAQRARRFGDRIPAKAKDFSLCVLSRVVLVPTKSHIQWVFGLSSGVKAAAT